MRTRCRSTRRNSLAARGVFRAGPPCPRGRRAVRPCAALAAGLLLGIALAASAAPPPGADPNDPMAIWFRDLMRPDTNTSCCDSSDCRRVVARMTPAGWDARIGNAWLPVPPDRVLHQNNPTGEAVACYLPSLGIICFVPPPQT
jgi:hypothetical protein